MGDASKVAPTVLRFRPRWPQGAKERWVLWPVWTRRVAAPVAGEDRLPPFEKAVLGCARANVIDSDHVAALLQLHPQLVDQLKSRLVDRGAMTPEGELTAEGLRCVGAEDIDNTRVEVRHIFQCAISQSLLPRIADTVAFAEVTRDGERWKIELGTPGEPRPTGCFLLQPPRYEPPEAPDAADVLRAVVRHSLDQRGIERIGRLEPGVERPVAVRAGALRRVTIVDREPQLVHLATVVYQAPDVGPGSLDWRIADPFGLGENSRLLMEGQRLRRNYPPFNNFIQSLIDRGETPMRSGELTARDLWELANGEVAAALPRLPENWLGREHLIRMHEARLSASEAKGNAQRRARLKDGAQNARCALEACFAALADQFPLGRIRGLIPRAGAAGDQVLRTRLERAASNLGVRMPLPGRFANVRGNHVFSVVDRGDMSRLTAAVMATLLTADVTPGHTLRNILGEWPVLLDELAVAIDVGGEASHYGDSHGPSDEDLERVIGIVQRLTNGLLTT